MSRSRSEFVVLVAALVALHACMAATRVTSSLWVLNQGYGEQVVGALLSLFAVAPMLLSLWAGRMADRHGLHRPLAVGVGLGVLGLIAAVVSPQVPTLALACLLSGGGLSVAAVGIQREAGLLAQEPHELKRVFSWVATGPAISNAVAPVAAGLLIDHVGYRAALGFAIAMPLVAWALASRLPRIRPHRPAHAGPRAAAWSLLRSPAFRLLLGVNLVMAATWDAHTFIVPVVGHTRSLSASEVGLVLAAFAVAATAVRLLIVGLSAHLQEARVLRGAMGLAMVVMAVYVWLPGTWSLMAGSALLGLALGAVQPMVLSQLHQITPADRHGQALGLRMLVMNAATVGMPIAFGWLAATWTLGLPLWIMAAVLALAQWPARQIASPAPPARPEG